MKTSLLVGLLLSSSLALAQSDPLDGMVMRQALTVSPGATPTSGFVHNVAPRTDWTATFEQGKCYTLSGVGGPGVTRLSFFVWDPSGRRVADAKPKTPYATLWICPPWSGPYHVQAKIEGRGPYAAGVFAKPAGPGQIPLPAPIVAPAPVVTTPGPATAVVIAPPAVVVDSGPGGTAVYVGPAYGVEAAPAYVNAPPQECRLGADGVNVCGYNCRLGANGHFYCATVPGGQCALNADGTFSCP